MEQNKLGLLHIYCGDGKGKTTAALGQAVRAAGRGYKVGIARFLKTEASGEVLALRQVPGIQLLPCEKSFGFTFCMTEREREMAASYYNEYFDLAISRWGLWEAQEAGAFPGAVDLVILDEILGACQSGLIPRERLEQFLVKRRSNLEVILTGRRPWESLLELADYVTEMKAVKHPYTRGIKAREGIEW